MNHITTTSCSYSQNAVWPLRQDLEPEIISEKKWTQEYEQQSSNQVITWNNTTLSISLKYGGGYQHPFKAYLMDTSSSDKNSFTLLLEDQDNDDSHEGSIRTNINIDLKNFAKSGTIFKVMTLGWGGSANSIGETTFSD